MIKSLKGGFPSKPSRPLWFYQFREGMDPETAKAETRAYFRKVRFAAYVLMGLATVVYLIAAFYPIGPDWARGFYLSIAAGLLTSAMVVAVTALIRPPIH